MFFSTQSSNAMNLPIGCTSFHLLPHHVPPDARRSTPSALPQSLLHPHHWTLLLLLLLLPA
jgi:hypothetical protein